MECEKPLPRSGRLGKGSAIRCLNLTMIIGAMIIMMIGMVIMVMVMVMMMFW